MQYRDKKKICIVVQSLGGGGAERTTGQLSKLLNGLGHDVHIVTILNRIDYDYGGTLHNLGLLKDADDSFFGRIKRFLLFRGMIKKHNFDIVIDNRPRQNPVRELMYYLFLHPIPKTIFVVHNFAIQKYFPKWVWLTDYYYKRAKKIVCASGEIASAVKKKYGFGNVSVIYYPLPHLHTVSELRVGSPYILVYGRFDEKAKNYTLLLNGYSQSILPDKGIKLVLLGEGPDEELLRRKVNELGLENDVIFENFVNGPAEIIKRARFTVLTSRYEGFPMVLIEALSLGVPVVSVDCSSGPKEVIVNEENGLLIENNDPEKLAAAFDRMVTDDALYKNLKQNAKSSVAHLKPEKIAEKWQKLIAENE